MIVLIPSYEPTARLVEVVRGLRRREPGIAVLVVDDGSGPAYAHRFAEAEAHGAEVIGYATNRGKGHALKAGFTHLLATRPGADVVTADSDGQHTPADVLRVAAATSLSTGLVLGCRTFAGHVPFRSRVGNAISRRLFAFAAGYSVSDTQTGLRGVPAVLVAWASTVPGERFEYEQNQLLRLRGHGIELTEVPIETVYFEHNAGTHFRPLADSARVMLPVVLFAGASLAGFVVDTVVFVALLPLLGSLAASLVLARAVSGAVNYSLNRHLVFDDHSPGIRRSATGYAALAVGILAASLVGVTVLVGWGVPALLAKLLTDLTLFLVSYAVQRRVVFSRRPTSSATPGGLRIRSQEAHRIRTGPRG